METLQLTHKQMLKIHKDPQKAARAASLRYVSGDEPGIIRVRKGSGFSYLYKDKPFRDKKEIDRIRKLAIPPAWTNVWICASADGHLQATGTDVRGRKQYRYHPSWHDLRNETKFHRMYEFGKTLPALRLQVEKDICVTGLPERKVLATMVRLMEHTNIRVGNAGYEKLYGSYGLTTLKDGHVSIKGSTLAFSFKGKKGIYHNITIRNRRLARIVQACKDISGKELFQYYDEEGNRRSVDSGMVNSYIKEITTEDFTAKDFRTWAGTLAMLQVLKTMGLGGSETESRKNIVAALDEVSKKLGNSRAICKKYYVHPGLVRLYEEQSLEKHLSQLEKIEECDGKADLTAEEKVLMKILEELK